MARNEIPETIVSQGMRIEGELKSNGNIRIDGIVSGKVATSQELMIGATAEVDADVIALNAVVAGVIRGNVTIKNSLNILETGKIIGNVICGSFSIREGGFFTGNCQMKEVKQPEIPNNKSQIPNNLQ